MRRRRLPIGIQTFSEIRDLDAYYVDKTPWIERLVDEGKHYFLSRPRRFGKSLLVDTIKELFEGNEALFRGLHIHDRWNWEEKHPVVRLDFGAGHYTEPGELRAEVAEILTEIERAESLPTCGKTPASRFRGIVEELHRRNGRRVVVLVDEYDKPILDALFQESGRDDGHERAVARANRDFLAGFYAVVKTADAHIRFSFLTGISKFSKVSLFSTLNHLTDITLDPRYSAICGYTDRDLDTVFAPELADLDRGHIRDWYNGYNWRGDDRMYNPFGILQLFDTREFAAHWFETGSPRFLVETLFRRRFPAPQFENLLASSSLLSAFDVERIGIEALLFQTGYLTIHGEERFGIRTEYRLGYPNLEVRQALNEQLLQVLQPAAGPRERNLRDLGRALAAGDLEALRKVFHALFAGIPNDWFRKNRIAQYEGYYASVVYGYLAGAGAFVQGEDTTNLGRLDLMVRSGGRVYLFEFKVIEQSGSGSALAQLKDRRYADKYRAGGEPIHLVGVEFSSTTRNIEKFEFEPA